MDKFGIRKLKIGLYILISILVVGCANSQNHFPTDFNEKVFEHIHYLSTQIGERVSSTPDEANAANYIKMQLDSIGIKTEIEEFSFEAFKINIVTLWITDSKFPVKKIYFNPYETIYQFEGSYLLTDSFQNIKEPSLIQHSIIITKNEEDYFRYAGAGAKLVLIVDSSTVEKIKMKKESVCSVIIHGGMMDYKSQTVVGKLPANNDTEKYIILAAHHDSYPSSPGADDNASGVGALIELARYFRSIQGELAINLRFISFGSEEKGILGSRVYLNKHSNEMKDCVLMYNMDFIGGSNLMMEVLGGISGIPDTIGQNQFPEKTRNRPWEGISSTWRILEPDIFRIFAITNKPDWLVKIIRNNIQKLGVQVRETGNLGADQQTFTQAGVVSTSIGASGNVFHNPNDTYKQVNKESLQNVGFITSRIIIETMNLKGPM